MRLPECAESLVQTIWLRSNLSVKQLDLQARKNIAVNDDAMQAKRAGTANSVTLAKHHPWCL
jgi:hypothetical protein